MICYTLFTYFLFESMLYSWSSWWQDSCVFFLWQCCTWHKDTAKIQAQHKSKVNLNLGEISPFINVFCAVCQSRNLGTKCTLHTHCHWRSIGLDQYFITYMGYMTQIYCIIFFLLYFLWKKWLLSILPYNCRISGSIPTFSCVHGVCILPLFPKGLF